MALIRVRNLLQKFRDSEQFRLAQTADFGRDGEFRTVYELILTITDLSDHQKSINECVQEIQMSRRCFINARRCTRQQTLTIEGLPRDLILPRKGKCYIARKIRNGQERRTRVYTELEVCEPVMDDGGAYEGGGDIFAVLFLVKENRIHTELEELPTAHHQHD